jgi:glycosyltransferase involved in cell wall biosynthesis
MTPPVRLLEVGLHWLPETFLGWRLTGLAARGHDVTVASVASRAQARAGKLEGVRLLRVPHWHEPRWRKLVGAAWGLARLAVADRSRVRPLLRGVMNALPPGERRPGEVVARVRACARLARERPDVVHFEWESSAIYYRPLFEVWDCPVVLSCHGGGINRHPHSPKWRPRLLGGLPVVFDHASVVHCVSQDVAREAAEYGLAPSKARVIRSSVDAGFWVPGDAGTPDDGVLRVVGVGRLVPSKGWEYAIRAIRLLVDAGVPVRYDIVGGVSRESTEPNEEARLRHAVADLELDAHVHFRGIVPSEGVRALLHESDIFLYASISDGLPTVVVEAMSCGLPVVATAVGGTPEAVRDGVDGLLVAPRDPDALAHALRELWEDPQRRRQMGASGRERAAAEFRLDTLLDEFESLYAEVAAPGRAA